MKPIIVLGVGFVTLAGGLWEPAPNPFAQDNTFNAGGFSAPGYRPPRNNGFAPLQPMAPIRAPRSLGPDHFTPYKPKSVYSNRGGINAYPSAPKPKGYIDIYRNDDN